MGSPGTSIPYCVGTATVNGEVAGFFRFNLQGRVANSCLFADPKHIDRYFVDTEFDLYKGSFGKSNKFDEKPAILEADGVWWSGVVNTRQLRIVSGHDPDTAD